MTPETSSLDTLNDIKKMMEKSSRFISLSGWSGIAAGICALAGAFFTQRVLTEYHTSDDDSRLIASLITIAATVFIAAFLSAFFFTYVRSRRERMPIWGTTARRLLWNTMLPMVVGGIVIIELLVHGNYQLAAPYSLIFYGLALVNGSKYTLGEIKYLGYIEIILGIITLGFPERWLTMWTIGFGIMHIIYGAMMWWKYERK